MKNSGYDYQLGGPLADKPNSKDDAMNTMTPSVRQIDKTVDVIEAAAKKGGREAISELVACRVLNARNFQHGVLTQGDKIAAVVKAAVRASVKAVLIELAEGVAGRLKRLFVDRRIELAATDGSEMIAEAKEVFAAGIYGATRREACKATAQTDLVVYEIIKDGTYSQIFGGFGENLKRLCWTKSQIVVFCRDRSDRLRRNGSRTFFLYQGENGGFFVASVCMGVDGRLSVYFRPLEEEHVWCCLYQHRVVVPKL